MNAARRNTKAALYLRVSTSRQETENQRAELEALARRAEWNVVEVYEDKGVSAAKKRKDRPALVQMLKDARLRKFKLLVIWDLSRLGRNLRELLETANELHESGVDLFIAKDGTDTSTPSGRLFFNLLGSIAEFERERIGERVAAGIAKAKAKGKKFGRPVKLTPSKKRQIKKLREQGLSYRKIGDKVGLSHDSIKRALQQ